MNIVLFAIIGAAIEAGAGYWICYGLYAAAKVICMIGEVLKDD